MISLKGGERSGRSNVRFSDKRWKIHLLTMAVAGAGLSSMIANSYGATLQKANNTTPLNAAASWVQNVAPTAADTLLFDNTVQAGNTAETLGGALSVTGIQIQDPAGAISITDPNILTLGAGGIDMSIATQNLALALPVALSAAQDWNVGAGVTLTDSGTIDTTGGTLTVRGAGNTTLSGLISGANGVTKNGSGTLTLSNAESYTGATTIGGGTLLLTGSVSATSPLVMGGGTLKLNGTSETFASVTFNPGLSVLDAGGGTMNFSAVTRNTGGTVRFMPGSSYTVPIATAVSSGTTANTYYATYGLTDAATNDGSGNIVGGDSIAGFWLVGTPSSSAQRFNGTGQNRLDVGTVAGLFRSNTENPQIDILRFNSPQGGYQTGRDGNNGPVFVIRNTNVVSFNEILVTPNVGAEDVFITDDATINNTGPRINGSDMVLWQNNTQGFLVFNVGISNAQAFNLVKNGAGTVLINGASSYNTNTVLDEGTLEIGNRTALGTSSSASLVFSGGNLLSLINYQNTNNGQFSGGSKGVILNGAGGTIASITGTSFGISGVVSGVGGVNIGMGATDATTSPGVTVVTHVTDQGNGTVVFANANTYTGLTDVKFGTLQVSNGITGSGTGTGNVVVESGAILGGNGSIAGNVVVKAGGFVAPGDAVSLDPNSGATNIGTLAVGGKISFASGAAINYEPGDVLKAATFSFADSVAKMFIYTPGATSPFFGGGSFTVLTAGSSAAINAISSKFTTASIQNPAGANTYSFSVSGSSLLLNIVSPAITSQWIGTDQSWNLTEETNWSAVQSSPLRGAERIPQQAYDTANFAGSGSSTVKIDGAITVGFINLSNASYNITNGSGSLTLNAQGVNAQINDLSASQTISANLTLSGNLQLNVNNSGDTLTVSGNITGGANTLVKTGPGTAVITGANTLGATTISGGTLQVGNGGTTGNIGSTGSISDAGLLRFKRSDNVTIANTISGSGSVEQAGTGTLTLSGPNTYSGGTTVSSGVLQMGNLTALGTGLLNLVGSSQVDVNGLAATFGGVTGTGVITNLAAGNTTITISNNADRTFDGRVAETSGKGLLAVVKAGAGELNLTNLNTYTGGTFVTAGAIVLNPQGQASGTSVPGLITTSGGGQVRLVASLVANNAINMTGGAVDAVNFANSVQAPAQATLTGAITATGTTVYQMGIGNDFGTLTLTGTNIGTANVANLSQGDIIFSGTGKLQLLTSGAVTGGAIRIGTSSNATVSVINGASMTTTAASGDGLVLGTGGAGDPNFQLANTLNITGGTVDIGTSTLNLQGSSFDTFSDGYNNSILNLNTGGVLRLAEVRQQIGSSSQQALFNFNGGTLVAASSGRIFDNTLTWASVHVLANGAFVSVDNTTVVNATLGHGLDHAGSGLDGGFTKLGAGTLTLTADSSYNGGTTVAAGDLLLGSTSLTPLGTSFAPLTVTSGAQLNLNNHDLKYITALNGGGAILQDNSGTVTLTFGNSDASGTFSGGVSKGSGVINMIKTGAGTQTFSGVNSYGSLTISTGAVLAAASGTLDQGTILVNSNNGLEIADGVSVGGSVFTNVTGEFEDVLTGNGTISGPVTRQSGNYIAGISGSGSLTLSNTQNISGATTATVDRGNVILASLGNLLGSTATFTVGSPTAGGNVSFTARDNSTLGVNNIVIGAAGAQSTIGFTVRDNASVSTSAAGTVNLFAGAGTNAAGVVTVNLLGGTLTTGGFTKSSIGANQGVNINWNGGTIAASQANAAFLPALTGVNVSIGTLGAKFNGNGNNVTLAANMTGVAGDGGFAKSGTGTGTTTLTGNLTYTGATSVGGGVLALSGTNSIGTVNGAGTFQISGGTTTSQGITSSGLKVTGGALTIGTTGTTTARTSKVNTLTVSGGTMNIGNNHLIQESTAANLATDYTNDKALVTGGAITSSTLTSNTTLAVGEAGDILSQLGGTFGGVAVDANSVIMARTLLGDANMDGVVNAADFVILSNHYGTLTGGRWTTGDFNGDGQVNAADFVVLSNNYGSTLTLPDLPVVIASPGVVAAVPEPASLGILAVAGVGLLVRRRRRSV